MSTIINAAPFANLLGINDGNGQGPVYEAETLPTHLAHVYSFAQKGPTLPQLVSGDSLTGVFGTETMNPRSKFYNHGTHLVNVLQGVGNAVMFQRILPSDAGPKSRLLLSLDIVADQVPTYQRNSDGSYLLDDDGAKVPTGTTVAGYKARWVLNDWTAGSNTINPFGECAIQSGALTSATNVQSQQFPILEFEVNFRGGYGNNIGMRLAAPTSMSAAPTNIPIAERLKAFIYRLQLVERASDISTANVVSTLNGEPSIEFVLKPKATNPQTDAEMNLSDIFIKSYQNLTQRGFPPRYGQFGRMKVYEANLTQLLTQIGAAEASFGTFGDDITEIEAGDDAIYMVNPFTAVNFDNVPYHTLLLQGIESGGQRFGENATMYATGGSDGTLTAETFDAAVRNQLANYGSLEAPLLDDAEYPQSVIYDPGYTLETKRALISVVGKRKDIGVIVSTQDVSAPINSASSDVSTAIALKTYARNFPESELYGTPVCRAMVVAGAGYMVDDSYRGLLPFTIELAAKFGRYMGAGTGVWRSGFAFDLPPNNQLTMFRDANITFKSAPARASDWDNGMVWAQRFDRLSYFFPAFQTVYDDDTSTLNSARTMFVAIECQKVAQRTWRELTGISSLTKDQFIERSNKLIVEKTSNRFDGSVVIVPTTYFTPADDERGYSWSTKIDMYTPTMFTVGTFTINANRISDLGAG